MKSHTCQQFPDSPEWTASQVNKAVSFDEMRRTVKAHYGIDNAEPALRLIALYNAATATLSR